MNELSITTRIATGTPRATPVSALISGDFSRTFGSISDEPAASAGAVERRQGNAMPGKKLPVDEAVLEPGDTASPAPKSSVSRRHLRSGETLPMPATMPFIAAPADNAAAPEKAATPDDAAPVRLIDDDEGLTLIATPLIVPPAIILVDPSQPAAPVLPVARDPATAAITASTVPAVGGSGVITNPAAAAIDQPAGQSNDAAGATVADRRILLPAAVQLLDPGTPAPVAKSQLDQTAASAPRIETPAAAPRFAVAPAGAGSADRQPQAVQPARQAFAAAFATLAGRASMRERDDKDLLSTIPGLTAPVASTQLQVAVQQVNDTSQGALDLRQDRRLQGMIDHIETLRDDANARDTRIRLVPDALGTVDVAVRRDGSAIHVRFSSTSEATRIVLNDAQPRLAALAEARGVHIAGSSVDGGSGGGNAPRSHQTKNAPIRPASAPRPDADLETDTLTDTRIA